MPITLIRGKDRKLAVYEHRRLMLDRALELLIEGKANTEYCAYRAGKLKEIIGSKIVTEITNRKGGNRWRG